MAQIGVAAAIGRSIDIPILIRTLGQNLNREGYRPSASFAPDTALLTYLEGELGGTGPNVLGMQVDDFHLPWWHRPIPQLKYTSYLSFATIHAALDLHRTKTKQVFINPQSKRPDRSSELNKPAYTWHPDTQRDLDNPCTRCRLYRAVALGAYDKLRDLQNLVNACETANQGEGDLAARRAAAFNMLYEAAVIKDAGTVAGDLGMGSQDKWTWGAGLTFEDLTAISRGADRHLQVPHSGYDMELRTGRKKGRSSPDPNPDDIEEVDDSEVRFDELSPDFPTIRDLHPQEIPIAFSLPALHHAAASDYRYDPTLSDFASRHRAKLRMQNEMDSPISPSPTSSDSGPQRPFPSMRLPPKNYVRPPTAQHFATRAERLMPASRFMTYGPTSRQPSLSIHDSSPPKLPLGSIYIPSEESHPGDNAGDDAGDDAGDEYDPDDAMQIGLSDEITLPSMYSVAQPVHPSYTDTADPAEEVPMTVVMADSDEDDIYIDDQSQSDNIPTTVVVSDSETEELVMDNDLSMGIPAAVAVSDSEDIDDSAAGDHPVQSGRDPLTGQYTAASFAQFQDAWLA